MRPEEPETEFKKRLWEIEARYDRADRSKRIDRLFVWAAIFLLGVFLMDEFRYPFKEGIVNYRFYLLAVGFFFAVDVKKSFAEHYREARRDRGAIRAAIGSPSLQKTVALALIPLLAKAVAGALSLISLA